MIFFILTSKHSLWHGEGIGSQGALLPIRYNPEKKGVKLYYERFYALNSPVPVTAGACPWHADKSWALFLWAPVMKNIESQGGIMSNVISMSVSRTKKLQKKQDFTGDFGPEDYYSGIVGTLIDLELFAPEQLEFVEGIISSGDIEYLNDKLAAYKALLTSYEGLVESYRNENRRLKREVAAFCIRDQQVLSI